MARLRSIKFKETYVGPAENGMNKTYNVRDPTMDVTDANISGWCASTNYLYGNNASALDSTFEQVTPSKPPTKRLSPLLLPRRPLSPSIQSRSRQFLGVSAAAVADSMTKIRGRQLIDEYGIADSCNKNVEENAIEDIIPSENYEEFTEPYDYDEQDYKYDLDEIAESEDDALLSEIPAVTDDDEDGIDLEPTDNATITPEETVSSEDEAVSPEQTDDEEDQDVLVLDDTISLRSDSEELTETDEDYMVADDDATVLEETITTVTDDNDFASDAATEGEDNIQEDQHAILLEEKLLSDTDKEFPLDETTTNDNDENKKKEDSILPNTIQNALITNDKEKINMLHKITIEDITDTSSAEKLADSAEKHTTGPYMKVSEHFVETIEEIVTIEATIRRPRAQPMRQVRNSDRLHTNMLCL